jgi:hypothetical protein
VKSALAGEHSGIASDFYSGTVGFEFQRDLVEFGPFSLLCPVLAGECRGSVPALVHYDRFTAWNHLLWLCDP